MPLERSLLLVKPDAFQRALVGEIIRRVEAKGLHLVGAKMLVLTEAMLGRHYDHLRQTPFFSEITAFMQRTPVLATCWEGVDCVATLRLLCGPTKAREAAPGTIRGDLAMSIQTNLIHTSDSVESAKSELEHFFGTSELFAWSSIAAPYLYSIREAGS